MSLSKERNLSKEMILNVSTDVIYNTNEAYQKACVRKIPTKVQMKNIKHIKKASQEQLFVENPELTSPKKNERKKVNIPVFSRMTGRGTARNMMRLRTEESPSNTSRE